MPLSVLVADPDDRAAVAFGSALRGTEFAFAGSVSHGKALLDALFTYSPWAVALDLSLPDHPAAPNVGWASTAPQLLEIAPQLRTIVTFRTELVGLVPGTLRAGVRSFAEKPYLREEILAALRHAASDLPPQRFHARSRRIPRSLALRYRTSSGSNTSVARVGLSRNLSETGLLASVPEKLPMRSVVHVDIELPDHSTIRGRGQVVREAGASPGAAFDYGVALFEMDDPNRTRLKGFIGRVLAGDPTVSADTRRAVSDAGPSVVRSAR
ncbi:MAG: PilZ domain-containing protein [Planctomycetota bacterium]